MNKCGEAGIPMVARMERELVKMDEICEKKHGE